MSARAREEAARTGELPHEFLLRISRGEMVNGYTPDFAQRMDAAKAAAPYFAARLASTTVEARLATSTKTAQDLTDDELRAIVEQGRVHGLDNLPVDPSDLTPFVTGFMS